MAVINDNGGRDARLCGQGLADLFGAGIGVGRQQGQIFVAISIGLHVAAIHAGIGTNPAALLFDDQ